MQLSANIYLFVEKLIWLNGDGNHDMTIVYSGKNLIITEWEVLLWCIFISIVLLLGYIFVAINVFGICIVLLLKLSSDLDTRHSSSTHTWNLNQVEIIHVHCWYRQQI